MNLNLNVTIVPSPTVNFQLCTKLDDIIISR